jgi:tetratricopeptide (TPR) repeat protein
LPESIDAGRKALLAKEPNPVLLRLRDASLAGLAWSAAFFLLVEALFSILWPEKSEDPLRLEKWKGFFDGYYVLLPVFVMMLVVRDWVFANATPAEEPFLDNPLRGLGFLPARLTAVRVWGMLLRKLVWPVHLSADYSYNQIPLFGYQGVSAWQNLICIVWLFALMGVVALAAWLAWKRQKAICFFILLYLINYFPTSNFGKIIGSIMAERFMYLPLIAFAAIVAILVGNFVEKFVVPHRWAARIYSNFLYIFLAVVFAIAFEASVRTRCYFIPTFAIALFVAIALDALVRKYLAPRDPMTAPALPRQFIRSALNPIIGVLLVFYGVRTFTRNFDWKSDLTLWTSAKRNSPMSFRSYQSYAFAVYEQVTKPRPDRLEEGKDVTIDDAIKADEQGLTIVDPLPNDNNSSRLYLHLGMYYAMKGELENKYGPTSETLSPEGVPWYRKSVAILERSVPIDRAFNEVNRGRDVARGKKGDQVPDVGLAPVYLYLGRAYARLGYNDQALAAFKYARHLEPQDAEVYYQMGLVQVRKNQLEDAAASLIQCVIMDPRRNDAWRALVEVFGHLNTDGQQAVVVDQNGGVHLNMNSRAVRDNFCSAYRDWVRVFRRAKRDDYAKSARDAAIYTYNYPATLFDPLFDETIVAEVPPAPVIYKPPAAKP